MASTSDSSPNRGSEWKALIADHVDGHHSLQIRDVTDSSLPAGDVTVRVAWSGLNYKDGLALTGRSKVIRSYPMVPGIDFSGVVESSDSDLWKPNDHVILTGWGVGEQHWGGYAQKARVSEGWLVPLPKGLSLLHAMSLGTAGLTAMMCVSALEEGGVTPERGPVLVTGASGGVGSLSVAILSSLGFQVTACTGRPELESFLKGLGAAQVIGRESVATPPGRPLAKEQWAAAIDVAGGPLLASVLSAMRYGGTVAVCGLAADSSLNTTVLPLILRGVSIRGIDSVQCPAPLRERLWNRLVGCVTPATLSTLTEVISLKELSDAADRILSGKVRGRIVVDVNLELD